MNPETRNLNAHPIDIWHRLIETGDAAGLDALLAEEVVFHSPVVHAPQVGKEITKKYLSAAFLVFKQPSFQYIREIRSDHDAMLEFQVEINHILVNGVDLIKWDAAGKITDFKVMIRPLKAVNLIHQLMSKALGL
ncbi:MAG: nuclear transport factor 2 family protein [Acidobacteria bacterium]|nr:MAG: nuclear transport factor 2 family protein [Acidobacteriota bacterium]REK04111.1 MAG: nuclear transport factor 2 family protein [Acidobacteriota bacterium]REK15273.1 MAG: nuclear transport factor 2 family protein [Acidobacteriota bacterium]REK46363.1 MAG: nuclear transport factor 2 family protein [Acidobacteriota bacterium]